MKSRILLKSYLIKTLQFLIKSLIFHHVYCIDWYIVSFIACDCRVHGLEFWGPFFPCTSTAVRLGPAICTRHLHFKTLSFSDRLWFNFYCSILQCYLSRKLLTHQYKLNICLESSFWLAYVVQSLEPRGQGRGGAGAGDQVNRSMNHLFHFSDFLKGTAAEMV